MSYKSLHSIPKIWLNKILTTYSINNCRKMSMLLVVDCSGKFVWNCNRCWSVCPHPSDLNCHIMLMIITEIKVEPKVWNSNNISFIIQSNFSLTLFNFTPNKFTFSCSIKINTSNIILLLLYAYPMFWGLVIMNIDENGNIFLMESAPDVSMPY